MVGRTEIPRLRNGGESLRRVAPRIDRYDEERHRLTPSGRARTLHLPHDGWTHHLTMPKRPGNDRAAMQRGE